MTSTQARSCTPATSGTRHDVGYGAPSSRATARRLTRLLTPGDEDAVDEPQAALGLGPRRSPASCRRHLREDLREQLLPVADGDRVDETADRREVGAGRAAHEHQGVLLGAQGGVKGDACQIEHLQQVRVVELVLKRHAQKMGFGHRRPRLQGQERDAQTAHLGDRVDPRAGRRARPLLPPSRRARW